MENERDDRERLQAEAERKPVNVPDAGAVDAAAAAMPAAAAPPAPATTSATGEHSHIDPEKAPVILREASAQSERVQMDLRRSPSTAARRKAAKDTEAQIEEWRKRQATRAVPHPEYVQGSQRLRRATQPAAESTPGPAVPRSASPRASADGRGYRNASAAQAARVPEARPATGSKSATRSAGTRPSAAAAAGSRPAAPTSRTRPPRQQPKKTQSFPVAREAAGTARRPVAATGTARPPYQATATQGTTSDTGYPLPEDAATRAKSFFTDDMPRMAKMAGGKAMAAAAAMDPAMRRRAIIIAVIAVLYLIVTIHFSLHFFPNSRIGAVDVSGMSVGEATEAVEAAAGGYELKVEGENGVSFTVMSHEAGLSLDAEGLVRQAMCDPGILWPIQLLLPHDHSDVLVASAASSGFRSKISDAVNWFNQEATAPKDATIDYDEGAHAFKIIPEVSGNTLDEEKIVEHVSQALAVMQPVLTLGPDDYEQPSIRSDDPRLQEAQKQAQTVLNTNATFKAHNSNVATLNGDTAAKWVVTDDEVKVALDEEQLNTWVQDVINKADTVGVKRTWTREDGTECTVEGGDYGWETDWLALDAEVHDAVLNGKTEEVDIPMINEAAAYNGPHGRDWKAYIDVDLDAQLATFYDDKGQAIWSAYFVSGSPDGEHDTPQGVYYVKGKESPSTLVGERNATGSPEYQTKVQYWIPWRGNDVGFHDAEWQDAFGGTRYIDGFGSHGCINLSPDDAASLYKLVTPEETVVVCHGSNNHKVENTLSAASAASEQESSSSSSSSTSSEADGEGEEEDQASDHDAAQASQGNASESTAETEA